MIALNWTEPQEFSVKGSEPKAALKSAMRQRVREKKDIAREKVDLLSKRVAKVDVTTIFFTPPLMAAFTMLSVPWYAPYIADQCQGHIEDKRGKPTSRISSPISPEV